MRVDNIALGLSMVLTAFSLFFAPSPWWFVGVAQFVIVCALYERI